MELTHFVHKKIKRMVHPPLDGNFHCKANGLYGIIKVSKHIRRKL